MPRVIIISRQFPSYHKMAAGRPTMFVERYIAGLNRSDFVVSNVRGGDFGWLDYKNRPKLHTIRKGRRWKKDDKASVRIWTGKPCRSPQQIISDEITIKAVYSFKIIEGRFFLDNQQIWLSKVREISTNDGFDNGQDFLDWFQYPLYFDGQIVCFSDVKY